ncbi:MAG: helix-turn-helix transcriptional regulator [Enhygromyxa sp.]
MVDERGPTPQQLAEHLQNMREDAGLSIEELARRAGLERDRVILIESGAIAQDLEELTRYAHGLGVPLSVVFRRWEHGLN